MKNLVILTFLAIMAAAVGTSCNSCAPTAPTEPDTTRMLSAPSSVTLTWTTTSKVDSTSTVVVGLNCGCPFAYTVIGYGGDTSVIHFNVSDFADTMTTHSLPITIYPSLLPIGPVTTTAWIALMTWNQRTPTNPGTQLFDTIRVTAIY
jgi:hypothetical protein